MSLAAQQICKMRGAGITTESARLMTYEVRIKVLTYFVGTLIGFITDTARITNDCTFVGVCIWMFFSFYAGTLVLS